MSCPYTSPQNGKAERTLRTINNMIRSLLFQASFPARYWVEGLHTATYLLNRLPNKTIRAPYPYVALHGVASSYEHLRVFGCACYPNLSAQAPHKLAPRSTRCVFLGYSADHKGYRCLDLSTNNIIVSRHVVFDEADFPFAASPRLTNDLDIFLQDDSPGAVLMPAPLPAPHVPPGFLSLAAASGQTSRPGGQTAPGTEAGGRPKQELAVRPQAQAVRPLPEQGLAVQLPPRAVRPPDPAQLLRRLLRRPLLPPVRCPRLWLHPTRRPRLRPRHPRLRCPSSTRCTTRVALRLRRSH
jgi:hypothetical protein